MNTNHSNKSKKSKDLDVEECACFNFRKAARTVTQFFDDIMQPCGLRSTQFNLLAALNKMESATVNQLSQVLVMDRTTLTRNLKPLEKARLLKIVPGEDRRTRSVSLTAKGQTRLQKALPYWEKAQTQVIERLTPGRWQALMQHLGSTVRILGQA